MADVPIARVAEVADESVRRVEIDGRSFALVKTGGRLYVLDDRCPHAGGPLGEGFLEGGTIRCPWHERHFDPATGACVDHPRTRPAATFPVRVEGEDVIVSL